MSATTPMICRSVSAANSRITPLPMTSRSVSGSPFGQNCFAIASLMMTTGVDAARVALVERAAALHRDLEDLEVAGRHRHPAAAAVVRTLAVGGERPADDAERQAVAALQRHAARRARLDDAGNRLQLLDAVAHQLLDRLRLARTARLSATSASSARCACRSRDRRGRAPSRSGSAAPIRSAGPAPARLRPRPGSSAPCSAGSRCPIGRRFPSASSSDRSSSSAAPGSGRR